MLEVYNKKKFTERLRMQMNPFKKEWSNIEGTNCYAYALGLDNPRSNLPFPYNYNPGSISGIFLSLPFNSKELLFCLRSDLRELDIDFQEVYPDFIINRANNEWKIAVMAVSENGNSYNDFHFLRQTENGIWTHKKGDRVSPIDTDSRNKKIISPVDNIIETDGFFSSTRYDYLKTYCLRKK